MKVGTIYGVQSLDDMRDRCVIDPDTGCWSWGLYKIPARGGPVPAVWVPSGVLGEGRLKTTAIRAAWLFSGRKIRDGHIVWRCCGNKACINPDHCRSTSKAEHGRWIAKQGHTKGPHRAAAARVASLTRAASPGLVEAIERDIGDGVPRLQILERHGTSNHVYYRVLRGQHPHQRVMPVAGASVFSWRPA